MSHRGVAVAPCDYGNGLVAAESHARGAVALSELPFCFVLVEARASSACDLCLAPHAKMRCARCKAVRYCDAQCQRGAWKNALHKGECGLLAAGGVPAAALDNVRLVCRMAWRLRERDERAGVLCPLTGDVLARMEQLAAVRTPLALHHYQGMAELLSARWLVWLDSAAIATMLMQLHTNAMRVPDGANGSPLAVALYPMASAANHACDATTVACFAKHALELIVVAPALASGQPITVGYVDVRIPRAIRQWLLYDTWAFVCQCALCTGSDALEREITCSSCKVPTSLVEPAVSLSHSLQEPIACPDEELTWKLFESLGDSEWHCANDARDRFTAFCARVRPLASCSAHPCADALQGARTAVQAAVNASELAAVSPTPKLRFAELVWMLVIRKGLVAPGGYYWRCAAMRYALHSVNVASSDGRPEAEQVPLFQTAARVNEELWRQLRHSWPDRPLVLGCMLSQVRCDAFVSSYLSEQARGPSPDALRAWNAAEAGLAEASTVARELFACSKLPHRLLTDLRQTRIELGLECD